MAVGIRDQIVVDENGYVFVGGLKVCRIYNGQLEFHDRSKLRAEARGSQFVYVDPEFFFSLIRRLTAKDNTNGQDAQSH